MTLADPALLVGDRRQFASVRRIVLDEGAERGVRALLFSTGGGLDFMVLVDRAMDIGTLSHAGRPVAWQAPGGFRSPFLTDLDSEGGTGFNRSFSGLLVTCGLDHIRQPQGGAPLHGRLPGTPARLLAHGEDWGRDEPVLYCEGEAVQASYGREALRLRRRIEAPIGGGELRIIDRVENCGIAASPLALLYHLNLGYPAITSGSLVSFNGRPVWPALQLADAKARPEVVCLPAGPAREAHCVVASGDLELTLAFATDGLPFMQFYRDLRPRAGLVAIEPATSDRRDDGTSMPGPVLQPGESRTCRLRLSLAARPRREG